MFIHRVAILLLALALPAHCATLFVSPEGDGTDGFSWEAAYTTVGDAVTASSTNDEVWIRSGTYTKNLVIQKPLKLIGGFAGNEEQVPIEKQSPDLTVLDGQGLNNVCYIESTTCELRHLSITNGAAERGAGVRCRNGSLIMFNCHVFRNGYDETTRRTFFGGGILVENSRVEIVCTTIEENLASTGPGGVGCSHSIGRVADCVISKNIAATGAGATISGRESMMIIEGCMFERNRAFRASKENGKGTVSPPQRGSDLWIAGTVVISNSIFRESSDSIHIFATRYNPPDSKGTGVVRTEVLFANCTFDLPPSSPSCTWEAYIDGLLPRFENCILIGSDPFFRKYDFESSISELDVSYSDILGGYPGEGNIDADPGWVDQENGDYHLQRSSPCIDSGTGTLVTTDFDGKLRPLGRYDMGAFEFPYLRSDINVDGAVDAMDLLIFQEDWGLVSQP
jgi:hypothetical protein